jgi:hypothetical protein
VRTVLLLALCVPSAALAQRPSRADFENAVLSRAASRVDAHACEAGDPDNPEIVPARALTRRERARVVGRAIALPDGRAAAIVQLATGASDANEDLARSYVLVVLAPGAPWTSSAIAEIDVGAASFEYEEPTVRIARLEDVDDDGELELFVVMETNTETYCGTGYCTVRRSIVADVADRAAPVTANVESSVLCDAESYEQHEGTVLLRDANGDGHRDLVLRARYCTPDDEGNLPEGGCSPPRESVYLWQAAGDRYLPPPRAPR